MAIRKDKRISMYIDRIKFLEGINRKKEESLLMIHRQSVDQRKMLETYAKAVTDGQARIEESKVKIVHLEALVTSLLNTLMLFGSMKR